MLTSKLETPELKRHDAIAQLDDMHECIEVVGRHDEAVALRCRPPPTQTQVAAQRVLQRAREVLVKDRVEVVVVSARVAVEL